VGDERGFFQNYIIKRQQKIRQTAEKKLKFMQQKEDNIEAKCKGDFYGKGLALFCQHCKELLMLQLEMK